MAKIVSRLAENAGEIGTEVPEYRRGHGHASRRALRPERRARMGSLEGAPPDREHESRVPPLQQRWVRRSARTRRALTLDLSANRLTRNAGIGFFPQFDPCLD